MLDMGIIKVEVNFLELKEAVKEISQNRKKIFEILSSEIKLAASTAVSKLIDSEMTIFLGKNDENNNKRNGFEIREYAIKGIGGVKIKVPVDRKRKFESKILPKGEQLDPRLKEDLAVLHLSGISTRTLSMISDRILGVKISKQTVSNSLELVKEKAKEWLTRPISEDYWALYIDGTNFKIQRRWSTELEPSLVVLGINEKSLKSILSIDSGTKDNAETWRIVFKDLIKRGLNPMKVRIGIMDGLVGLETAFRENFPNAVTARCWVHTKRNALAKVSERLRIPFEELLNKVMYSASEDQARVAFKALKDAMGKDSDRAVRCIEKDLESLLVHYKFEKSFWLALKTTNPIERVNKEFKRRTRSMGSFSDDTKEVLTAFTALRLEMNWRSNKVNSSTLENLKHLRDKVNPIEKTVDALLH